MQTLYATTVDSVGPDAADLLAGGVLILFGPGAPEEVAEVAVLHRTAGEAGEVAVAGDVLAIGAQAFRITAIGPTAWAKLRELGHVIVSFTGADSADRPGEICVAPLPDVDLTALVTPGASIAIRRAG